MSRPPLLLALTLGLAALGAAAVSAQTQPPRMLSWPDLAGDRIAFSSEGDLWLGSLSSGTAYRLTTHEGTETRPRFSPDGTRLAFSASYDGGQEVYVMPAEGGAPRRVTYDPAGATLMDWTPDGKQLLFRSSRGSAFGSRLYVVPAEGGVPVPLPMENAAQGSFSPDGKRLAYCRLALENHHWKRYHGGQANRVWIADLEAKRYKKLGDGEINEQYPQWVGDTIYYVSEKDGTANLWRYDTRSGNAKRLTSHDTYDVRQVAADGQRVVYQCGAGLCLYDPATGRDEEVQLNLSSDRVHARAHMVDGTIGPFALGPTGKRIAVETRGQLYTLPAKEGEIRAVAPLIGTRSKRPVWSPDGKWIAFFSDRSGEENLWVAPAGGPGEPRQLTTEAKLRLDGALWSPDSKKLLYRDNTLALWLLDVETKARNEVARSDYAPISSYRFSPDGAWIAYSRQENLFVQSLYLYRVADGQVTRLTQPPTQDSEPVFDPAGKYLYFLSDRNLQPTSDAFDFQNNFDRATRIYALALAKDTPALVPVDNDEEPEAKPASPAPAQPAATPTPAAPAAPGSTPAAAKPSSPTPAATKIDLEGLGARLMELPIAAGRYSGLDALPGKILYLAREEGPAKLKQYDFVAKRETEIAPAVIGYDVSFDRKKVAIRTPAGLQIADAGAPLGPAATTVSSAGWKIEVDPEKEWRQIFHEAWRNHRDLFYDPAVHGQDWESIRKKYEALLPAIGSRAELNDLIGEMQGEMNVSHEFVGGGYNRRTAPPGPGFGGLGADLELDSASKQYRITRILEGDGFEAGARSPLLAPGLNVKAGDYLLAINGTPLRPDADPNALLIGTRGRTITLLVNSQPTQEGARTIRIKAMASEGQARYYDWVARCRGYVRKNGGPNLGYIHLPDMMSGGITEFTKHFYANLDKDGLVIDVRYNGGGIISGQILERLRRVIFEYDQGRYGAPVPYHRTAYLGRLVVVCNESTGSDGEYFCTGFRYLKLGPTVGTRTWGGYMAVGGGSAIDGGFVSTPVQGSFTPEGKWLPDGYGFKPDYVVDEDPNAAAAGRDPQLDKAIELLKEQIKNDPPRWPKRLDPPSKQKAFPPNRR